MAGSLQLMTVSSATASSSKLHKLSNEEMNFNDDIDRISDLPDSVICHILSFLKTKNAAVTSILSTRWRYLWTWVTTLDFEYLAGFKLVYLNVGDRVGYRSFVDLVCRALFLRNNGSCIKKFRLFCPVNILDLESSDSFHFNAWVCAAVTRGVEELDLSRLIMMPFDQPVELTQCVELPQSLFTCKTLKVLNLYGEIVLNVPSSVHLPSLKILFLGCVKYAIDDSVSKLLSGCPVLENLSIGGFYCDKLRIISAPFLKKLKLKRVCSHCLDGLNLSRPEINVPALEYLSIIVNSVSGAFPIENLSSLVEAELQFFVVKPNEYSSKCALELLRGLYNVKFLTLFSLKMETFPYVSNDDLPMFHNLTRLKIIGAWHLLPNFLENSHNLRVLSLEETCYRSDRHGCCRWPQCVPKCLSSHLMTIHIERFEGLKGELKLVRYILKNAKVLKTMSICCHRNSKEKARLLEKILMFPRGSETCQVTIN